MPFFTPALGNCLLQGKKVGCTRIDFNQFSNLHAQIVISKLGTAQRISSNQNHTTKKKRGSPARRTEATASVPPAGLPLFFLAPNPKKLNSPCAWIFENIPKDHFVYYSTVVNEMIFGYVFIYSRTHFFIFSRHNDLVELRFQISGKIFLKKKPFSWRKNETKFEFRVWGFKPLVAPFRQFL